MGVLYLLPIVVEVGERGCNFLPYFDQGHVILSMDLTIRILLTRGESLFVKPQPYSHNQVVLGYLASLL